MTLNPGSFWEHVRIPDERKDSSCWEWTSWTFPRGHGFYRVGRKTLLAHRVSYEIHFGAIAHGLDILRTCGNKTCVNPSHLEAVTRAETVRRRKKRILSEETERFWQRVDKKSPDECWEWLGSRNPSGYGQFYPQERTHYRAHRYSYELEHGPVPDGMCIDHLCRNRACVNPAHLQSVTPRENSLRGIGFARNLRRNPGPSAP